jgi:integrase
MLPSGRFQARWKLAGTMYTAPQTYETESAAFKSLAQIQTDSRRNVQVDHRKGKLTVETLVTDYLTNRANIKPKTRAGYESLLRSCICGVGGVGGRKVGDVVNSDVRAWTARMSKRLSPSRVRQAHRLLSLAFDQAVRDKRVGSNPCADVPLPAVPEPRHNVLTTDEIDRLRAVMPEECRVIVDVMAYGGLRIGEALALRRKSVDVLRKRLLVSESLSEASVDGKNRLTFERPKSGKSRSVDLPPSILTALSSHMAARVGAKPDALLFPAKNGEPMRYGSFYRWRWSKAVDEADLGDLRPHDLRATCASLLIAAGASVADVQAHLGHREVTTTLRVYTQITDGAGQALAKRLEDVRSGTFGGTSAGKARLVALGLAQ